MDHSITSMASTLVGIFLGPRKNIDIMRSFIKKKWAHKGHVSITTMAKGFFSFDFSCTEDLSNILCEGPWDVGCCTLVLQKWSSKMNLNDSFFVQAPIWVRLPKLPLKLWNEDVFVGVANSFGEILSVDLTIASKRQLTYAHICIGVREGVEMPETVTFHSKLGVHVQKLIYEMVPFACFLYFKFGHKASQCPKDKVERKKSKPTSTSVKVKKMVWK